MKKYSAALLTLGLLLSTVLTSWAYQTDEGIASSISNSYIFNNYLRGEGDTIAVSSQNGVVTLTGTVADENHKFLAQNTAENQPDVKSVNNELQVRSVPAEYSDAWLGLKVKAALLFHRNVSAVRTQVNAKDGLVTLSGDVDSQAQKDLTAEYARGVDGVKAVNNIMVIHPMDHGPSPNMNNVIDDASITAQVKMVLFLHQSTSAIHTHVKTENGVVTLTGTASNEVEKSLATKLVSDINGVKNVINNMDVQ